MDIRKEIKKESYAVKILVEEEGRVAGWVYLYVLNNDLHEEPFGLVENLYVKPEHRSRGIGTKLVEAAIDEAKRQGCYKLIGTSRHSKIKLLDFYKRFGFASHGVEFRIDLKAVNLKSGITAC
jgi:GNAT superfamily N-acetyltransferase